MEKLFRKLSRKGPRVSRRLCGFRGGRPFSGSVENPSFFFFFFATHPHPPKNQATFFLLAAPLEPSIEARSPVDPESTVKNIPSNEGNLAAQRGSGSSREEGKDPKTSGPHRSSGRPSRYYFFFWVAETQRRGLLEQREVCRFFTTTEREGERRRQARRLAERRGRSRTITCVRLRTSAGCSWPPQADDQTRTTTVEELQF